MDVEQLTEAISPPEKYAFVPITDYIADHWVLFLVGLIVSLVAAWWLSRKFRDKDGSLDPVSRGVVVLVGASTVLMFGLSHLFGGYQENIEHTEAYQEKYQTFENNLYEYGMSSGGYLINPEKAQNFVDGYPAQALSITDMYMTEVRLDQATGAIQPVGSYPVHSPEDDHDH